MSRAGGAVRAPAVAGRFYPGEAGSLAAEVDAHLGAAPGPPSGAPTPKALIVPHAGYVYSGPVAGTGYARLRPAAGSIRRVVLLGPAHRMPVRSMAVPTVDAFATPLGAVPIDGEARRTALARPGVVADDRPHDHEHSLEVHLPFLQRVLGPADDPVHGWSVLPVLVGGSDDAEVADLLDALWGGDETVIVVSTDLSHYHDHRTAQRLDAATVAAMMTDRLEAIGPTDACGAHPVRGLLLACRRRGLHPDLVDRATSADTAGDPDRVVGYAALEVAEASARGADDRSGAADAVPPPGDPTAPTPPPPPGAVDAMGAGDRARLLEVAEAGLRAQVSGADPRSVVDLTAMSAPLRRPGASFVTIRTTEGELRGCIGSIEAHLPLAVDVADNAGKAAAADPRFPPVRPDELGHLALHVAVLTEPEPLDVGSWDELLATVRPGVDGLVVEAGRHRGTFLPAVWDQLTEPAEFLDHLWRKAGLRPRRWPRGLRVERYEALDIG